MGKMYFANAFSFNMLSEKNFLIMMQPIEEPELKKVLEVNNFISAISHQGTATILSQTLQIDIQFNRIDVKLGDNDVLIVAVLGGPRLPEGKVLDASEVSDLPMKFWIMGGF